MVKKRLIALALVVCVAVGVGLYLHFRGSDVLDGMEPGEDTVLTVDGYAVNQAEFVYYLTYCKNSYESFYSSYFGSADGIWETGDEESDETLQQQVQEEAKMLATQTVVIRLLCDEAGIRLTRSDIEDMQNDLEEAKAQFEDDAAWQEALRENGLDEETYNLILQNNLYYTKLEEYYLGDDGEFSDEEVRQYYEDNYMRARHILISTTAEDGEALTDEEVAQKEALAQDILAQLQEDPDKFDELLEQYGEDPGMKADTDTADGYVFTENDSYVAEFIEGTQAPEIGEMSPELVESAYGYHIIQRLPLLDEDYEDMVDDLRYSLFESLMDERMADAEVETTDLYDEITVLTVADYVP